MFKVKQGLAFKIFACMLVVKNRGQSLIFMYQKSRQNILEKLQKDS